MRLCHDELQKSNEFTKSMDLMTYNSAYLMGLGEPRYSLPVVSLQVVWPYNHEGYADMVFIDDVSDPNDPVMVCCWDFYNGAHAINGGTGVYTNMDSRY